MSISANVVVEFGNTVVEMRRHWGGAPEMTGNDLIGIIEQAPKIRERGFYHEGGYVLRLLLNSGEGSLPEYEVIDGLHGQDSEYGYHIKYVREETEDTLVVEEKGSWIIKFVKLEGWETFKEWPEGKTHSLAEFKEIVEQIIKKNKAEGRITDT